MEPKKLSKNLLMRLPRYLEYLEALPDTVIDISSGRIAQDLELGAVMVRKDLSRISDGGRRRLGHVRKMLIRDIRNFLEHNISTDAIVIGAEKLGQALLDYEGFEAAGLNVMAGFDAHAAQKRIFCGKPIYPLPRLEHFCEENRIRIAILTVPEAEAQQVCDKLVSCGVQAIWNFAPVPLNVPEHVVVQSENLAVSLAALQMQLKSRENRVN